MSLGLVLSGGGTRCVAQLAIIASLQEWGIAPTQYAGASGGALVACLISAGNSPEAVMKIVKELRLLSLIKLKLNRKGLIDIGGSLKVFTDTMPEYFEDLTVPVAVTATNMRTGLSETFSQGPLLAPLLASCCMPVFFSPIKIGEDLYIDAGITNNFPADVIWGKSRYLLGIHTNPVDPEFHAASVRNILERTFLLTINGNVKTNKSFCHQVLEPDFLRYIRVFDFSRVEEIYDKTLHWIKPLMPALAEEIHRRSS